MRCLKTSFLSHRKPFLEKLEFRGITFLYQLSAKSKVEKLRTPSHLKVAKRYVLKEPQKKKSEKQNLNCYQIGK